MGGRGESMLACIPYTQIGIQSAVLEASVPATCDHLDPLVTGIALMVNSHEFRYDMDSA